MNELIAAGLFDGPWLVVLLIVASALVNWLSNRRQSKQSEARPDDTQLPPTTGKPRGEMKLEEMMRRLMGEEEPASPPPLPHDSRSVPEIWEPEEGESSQPPWLEERPVVRPVQPAAPPVIPTTGRIASELARARVLKAEARRAYENARRFKQHQRGQPAGRVVPLRSSTTRGDYWRSRRTARKAFVDSLVFGPPKGLEP
jgi:hypothetical protein